MSEAELVSNKIHHLLEKCQQLPQFADKPLSIDSRISGGTVNQCWKLKSGDSYFLARLSKTLPEAFLTQWHKEIELNLLAANKGLAPEPVWLDIETLSVLYPWCGRPVHASDLSDARLQELGEKLSLLHQLDSPAESIGYRQTIESYLKAIKDSPSKPENLKESQLLELADKWDTSRELVFCHHDLSNGNILWNDLSFSFIDWEYARIAHPLFDLASLSYHFNLSHSQLDQILAAYSFRSYRAEDVHQAEQMVKGLEKLWQITANHLLPE